MTKTTKELQNVVLDQIKKHKTMTTIFLTSGTKLQGIVTDFDAFTIILLRESTSQLVYKHAIATIMPNKFVRSNASNDLDDGETSSV